MKLRDRIKDFRRVSADLIRPNPMNWAVHSADQRNALRGILAEVGVAGAVAVRELPDGTYMTIDGHLRTEEIGPHIDVPVLVLDVTEEEAKKLLLVVNTVGQMVGTDPEKVAALMDQVRFEGAAVNKMLADMAGETAVGGADGGEANGDGKPASGGDPVPETWGVLVDCANEAEQVRTITILQQNGVTNFRTLVG